jgi:hypothetical protein
MANTPDIICPMCGKKAEVTHCSVNILEDFETKMGLFKKYEIYCNVCEPCFDPRSDQGLIE